MEYLETLRKVQVSHNTLAALYEQLAKLISNLYQLNISQVSNISNLKEQILNQNSKIEMLKKRFESCPEIKPAKEMKPEPHSLLEILNIKSLREKPMEAKPAKKTVKDPKKHKKSKNSKSESMKTKGKRNRNAKGHGIGLMIQQNKVNATVLHQTLDSVESV